MNGWLMALAGLGGAAGALVRYAVSRAFARRGSPAVYATMAVNLAGSFAAGLLYGWQMPSASPELYALAGIGFMGGMTTYSTLNVQKSQLAKEGNRKLLYICLLITYPGCILLAGLGVWTGKLSG